MTRRKAVILGLLAVMVLSLPVYAAAIRGRPQGNYKYNMDSTVVYAGQTFRDNIKGTFKLSGLKIRARSYDGEVLFNFRFKDRINRQTLQKTTATGNVKAFDDDGVHRGRLSANVRVQKTRTGRWKVTVKYNGSFNKGPAKGAKLSGKIIGRSI